MKKRGQIDPVSSISFGTNDTSGDLPNKKKGLWIFIIISVIIIVIVIISLFFILPKKTIQNDNNYNINENSNNLSNQQLSSEERTCSDKGGVLCDGISDQCISEEVMENSCCLGKCYDTTKTCTELGGTVVDNYNNCDGDRINSADTITKDSTGVCCIGKYVDKNTEVQCNSKGGVICEGVCTAKSTEEFARMEIINEKMCCYSDCKPKTTCSEGRGVVCLDNQDCNGTLIYANDASKCCKGTCKERNTSTNNCGGNCQNNQKCVNNNCVQKTCSEYDGVICNDNQECVGGSFITQGGSTKCCYGSNPSCQNIITCNSDADCNDNNVNTYDYCYKSDNKCKYINDSITNFNIQKSRVKAVDESTLIDYCSKSDINDALPFCLEPCSFSVNYTQEKLDSEKQIRPCANSNGWGFCRTWWLECINDNQRKIQQILIKKTPSQDNYEFVISVTPWNVSIS